MQKRLLTVILAVCLCLSMLTGCFGKAPDPTDPTGNPQPPTDSPTETPTQGTTEKPTEEPTQEPTEKPTEEPTRGPTEAPTDQPTEEPTQPPTERYEGNFELNRYDITLFSPGESWGLYDGELPVEDIQWTSDDESVARIKDGVVTAVGNGTTTVYGTYRGVSDSCIIRCSWEGGATLPPEEPTQPPVGPTDPPYVPPVEPTDPPYVPTDDPHEPVKDPPNVAGGVCSFYNDAAFIGDSVSMMLEYQNDITGELGSAVMMAVGSYSVHNAITGNLMVTYRGQEMMPADALAAAGVNKVFIMLGMNDIGLYGIGSTISAWGQLINQIRAKCPDIQIYIQSCTPVWTESRETWLTNADVDRYNTQLEAFCYANGCYWVDVASYMKDSTNGLATRYCSDNFVHLTYEGAAVWIKVLKQYAGW